MLTAFKKVEIISGLFSFHYTPLFIKIFLFKLQLQLQAQLIKRFICHILTRFNH